MTTFNVTEPVRTKPLSVLKRAIVLVGLAAVLAIAQALYLVDHHSLEDVLITVGVGSFLIWGASYLWMLEDQPLIHTVDVTPEGIRIRDTQVYDVFLPYPKIKSIAVKERITFRDNLRDSFSWDGRSHLKGRQVAIVARKPVRAGRPLPVKTFRFKVDDPDALVGLANDYKMRYRGLPL